ncbi:UNVERIFIED_CONTAM: hypothetical protein FKN15_056433 [Acipenser sinensis]
MTEFWLISAPGEKTCQQTWDKLMASTTRNNNLSTNNKFNIPDLKVGTLDVLVGLSDELAKLDSFVESVVKKVSQYMADVLEDTKDKVQENLLANGVDLVTYITRFQWDMAKYPIKQSLKNISEIIAKQVTQIDNDLKARASAYNNLKGNLQNLERKNAGSLLTRSLADIVKREDFVLDSEYLITLLVVVPKTNYIEWQKTYETLAEMVVPRSTKYGLPVNFQAMLLQPNKKNMKKLREVLYDLYKHLDSGATGIIDVAMDIPGLNLSQQEYYPYVYYKIDCNLLDFK